MEIYMNTSDGAEMLSTSMLRVKVMGGSGKVRVGGPRDEQKDLNSENPRKETWTGVVPVWEQFGEPVMTGVGGSEGGSGSYHGLRGKGSEEERKVCDGMYFGCIAGVDALWQKKW